MNTPHLRRLSIGTAILLAALGSTGCLKSTRMSLISEEIDATPYANIAASRPRATTNSAIKLTATLLDPNNVGLSWESKDTEAGGVFVQFATNPEEDYTTLTIVPAMVTRYPHFRLAPNTTFIYRVLPYYGPVSEVAVVTTGEAPDDQSGSDNEPKKAPANRAGTHSIKRRETASQGAPAGLTARLASPRVVDLNWNDRSSDEEGYLVEASPDPAVGYAVIALLDPNTVSFQAPGLLPNTRCHFRVRAFYFGDPSNLDSKTTGSESPRLPEASP